MLLMCITAEREYTVYRLKVIERYTGRKSQGLILQEMRKEELEGQHLVKKQD